MANLQLYTLLYVTVNGRLLTEHAEVTVNHNSNASPVNTVAKGFAGVSSGAPVWEIDVTNAVPSADFEFDPGESISENDVVEIGVVGPGGKTGVSKGFILSSSLSHGVGREASLSFHFMGQVATFQ
jgi:hypothetical protein